MRRCAGCGRRAPKAQLVRLTLGPDGRAIFDDRSEQPGRGAYACSPACLERALGRGGLARALRARVTAAPEAGDWPARPGTAH